MNDLGEIQDFLGTVLFNLVVSVLQLRKSSSLQRLRCLATHQSLIQLLFSGDPRLPGGQALPLTHEFAACNTLEGNGPRVCFPWLTSWGFFAMSPKIIHFQNMQFYLAIPIPAEPPTM